MCAIDDVANGTVAIPPSLLAVTPQTSGCPASALRTLYVRAQLTTTTLRPPWRCHSYTSFVGRPVKPEVLQVSVAPTARVPVTFAGSGVSGSQIGVEARRNP